MLLWWYFYHHFIFYILKNLNIFFIFYVLNILNILILSYNNFLFIILQQVKALLFSRFHYHTYSFGHKYIPSIILKINSNQHIEPETNCLVDLSLLLDGICIYPIKPNTRSNLTWFVTFKINKSRSRVHITVTIFLMNLTTFI